MFFRKSTGRDDKLENTPPSFAIVHPHRNREDKERLVRRLRFRASRRIERDENGAFVQKDKSPLEPWPFLRQSRRAGALFKSINRLKSLERQFVADFPNRFFPKKNVVDGENLYLRRLRPNLVKQTVVFNLMARERRFSRRPYRATENKDCEQSRKRDAFKLRETRRH